MYFYKYLELLKYIKNCVSNKRDFTVKVDNKGIVYEPLSGFVVSITPLINIGMDTMQMIEYINEQDIIEIEGNRYDLYLGGWFENNQDKLMTDISVVINGKDEAIQLGKHCMQSAIYDIVSKKIISIT